MTTPASVARTILSYERLAGPELVSEYRRLFGAAPTCTNRRWLIRNCAWQLQARAFGGLPDEAAVRLEALVADIVIPADGEAAALRRRKARRGLSPGTTLTRTWHDQLFTVRVTESGFEWDGRPYRSLSAVARAITGAPWSGTLFFGLRERSRPARATP